MRGALWLDARAEDVKFSFALLPQDVLGDNAACGISGTQEKDFETGFMHVNRFAVNLDAVLAVLPCPSGRAKHQPNSDQALIAPNGTSPRKGQVDGGDLPSLSLPGWQTSEFPEQEIRSAFYRSP